MSWIEDNEYEFEYVCDRGHRTIIKQPANMEREEFVQCATCKFPASYKGFKPQKLSLMSKVAYDRNGRQAYAISDGESTAYISKTKYEYLQSGKVESRLTREYERHTQDKMEREFNFYRKEKMDSNASVSAAQETALGET
jgi:hypothetical protein